MVVNKPAGLVVHGVRVNTRRRAADDAARAAEPTLVDWLACAVSGDKDRGDDPAMRPGIVHRLDKATSGVMIVAKTRRRSSTSKNYSRSMGCEKHIMQWCWGVPKDKKGTIDAPIGIKNGSLKRSIHSSKMVKVRDNRIFRGENDGEK